MRGAAGVQPHHAPAVRTACFPPGRRESTGREGARYAGRRGHCPAHHLERRCCPMAFATRRPCFSTAQRRCLGGVATCAAGSAKGSGCCQGSLGTHAPTGLTLPLLAFRYHHRVLPSPPNPARSLSLSLALSLHWSSAQGESSHALPATDLQANLLCSLAPCPRARIVPLEGRSEWPLLLCCT